MYERGIQLERLIYVRSCLLFIYGTTTQMVLSHKAFINRHFNYCPVVLILMRTALSEINAFVIYLQPQSIKKFILQSQCQSLSPFLVIWESVFSFNKLSWIYKFLSGCDVRFLSPNPRFPVSILMRLYSLWCRFTNNADIPRENWRRFGLSDDQYQMALRRPGVYYFSIAGNFDGQETEESPVISYSTEGGCFKSGNSISLPSFNMTYTWDELSIWEFFHNAFISISIELSATQYFGIHCPVLRGFETCHPDVEL